MSGEPVESPLSVEDPIQALKNARERLQELVRSAAEAMTSGRGQAASLFLDEAGHELDAMDNALERLRPV